MKKAILSLVAAGATAMITGCATPSYTQTGKIEIDYCFAPKSIIQREWKKRNPNSTEKINGFFDPFERKIYCSWAVSPDANGELKPRLETLGEEIYHSIKGDFHTKKSSMTTKERIEKICRERPWIAEYLKQNNIQVKK